MHDESIRPRARRLLGDAIDAVEQALHEATLGNGELTEDEVQALGEVVVTLRTME
ncbi:MAG: hypothetical protein JWM98_2924 [Thermoleophilia bacterium]|nr:hypothetical protein [Thermoleophilia bacterium]